LPALDKQKREPDRGERENMYRGKRNEEREDKEKEEKKKE
jgi:hypothetical protein